MKANLAVETVDKGDLDEDERAAVEEYSTQQPAPGSSTTRKLESSHPDARNVTEDRN